MPAARSSCRYSIVKHAGAGMQLDPHSALFRVLGLGIRVSESLDHVRNHVPQPVSMKATPSLHCKGELCQAVYRLASTLANQKTYECHHIGYWLVPEKTISKVVIDVS